MTEHHQKFIMDNCLIQRPNESENEYNDRMKDLLKNHMIRIRNVPKPIQTEISIKKYSNHSAVKQMSKILKRIDYDDENSVGEFINNWSKDIDQIIHGADFICYILTTTDNTTIGFCLLSLVLSNNPTTYEKPYLINYIYTTIPYRHQHYGYKLLSYIQKRHNTIAITMPCSFGLFKKCNYKVGELPIEGVRFCKKNDQPTDELRLCYYP